MASADVSTSTISSWISKVLESGGLSFFTATCTIFGMNQGGTLLTSSVLGAVVLQTYITESFVMEACARAQALDSYETDGSSMFRQPRRYSMKIQERKYELSLLTKHSLGKSGSLFFSATTLASMYGTMWVFCSIFANSFADKFPLANMEDGGYKLYIALFMVVTVPMPCTSIVDQQWIQITCVTARLVMVILMVGTVASAYGADEPHFGTQVGPVHNIPLAKPSNIVQVTMTCMFASIMQYSVPTMAGGGVAAKLCYPKYWEWLQL